MSLGSKGLVLKPQSGHVRSPWVKSKEGVVRRVLLHKDKAILEGHHINDADSIDRMSLADPLDVLRAAVAQQKYQTSTGRNLFQLANQALYDGRGQKVYRKEWMEGTYEKFITLSSIEYDRNGLNGAAYGYITFHGESTVRPIRIDDDGTPGWVMEYDEAAAVPYDRQVQAPPSQGTEVPVDPKKYRLKAYPFYDPPNSAEFVEQLLKFRGVLPDPVDGDGDDSVPDAEKAVEDGSHHHTA